MAWDRCGTSLPSDQAAAYLQVNRETIYRHIRDGRLAGSRPGRAYRIPLQSIERLRWSTRTRGDVTPKEFADAEIGEFSAAGRVTRAGDDGRSGRSGAG